MRIAIYCGSSFGTDPVFAEKTVDLIQSISKRKMSVVYGGGHVGLMKTVGDAAVAAGVNVTGVITEFLADKELANPNIDRLIIVKDMHARKALMSEYADCFIAIPGGTGTLEEMFEAWTWAQLSIHTKPCGFLNINGYYDDLFKFFKQMVNKGFLKKEYADMLLIADDPDNLLDQALAYKPPTPKWQKHSN